MPAVAQWSTLLLLAVPQSPSADTPAHDLGHADTLLSQTTPVTLTANLVLLALCWSASSACVASQRCPTSLATRATHPVERSAASAWTVVSITATSRATPENVPCHLLTCAASHAPNPARAAAIDVELFAMETRLAPRTHLVQSLCLLPASVVTCPWILPVTPLLTTLRTASQG